MMRTTLKCALAVALMITASGLSGAAQLAERETHQASASAQTTPDRSRMEEVLQACASDKRFMGWVLVVRGNDVRLNNCYGFANLEWDIPSTPSGKFRLGSITTQFTAASILLLEERGKLKVDDPVKKYMPDAPAAWDKITIFHLLTHTSGIPSFTGFPDCKSKEPFSTTPEELVARFRDKPLDFQPGEKMSYSNSGYVLPGYLIEKITLETYDRFVQENIFAPLGMKDSGYESNSAIIPHRVEGYEAGPNGLIHAGFIHMTVPFSAGRALFHHRGPAEMGARAFRGQSSFGEFVAKDDQAF